MRKNKGNRILRFLKFIYKKLFRIHDTPQRIALGMGVGVFLGIIPGTGPLAAVFIAFLLHLNRAAALLGSLLSNTWISILSFLLSIKIGSSIMRINWQDAQANWQLFLKEFTVASLFKATTLKIILPVLIGYFVISFCLGLIAYILTLLVITRIRLKKATLTKE